MSDDHHAHGHDHPTTFDEVIARGFRPEPPDDVRRRRETPRPVPPEALRLPAVAARATRKNAVTGFTTEEQEAFKNAVRLMVEQGTYLALVREHMDMSHMMHGSMGAVGLYRFLGWHRRYLVEFERALQRADATVRPGAPAPLGVPYWRWPGPFPSWMEGFLPAPDPNSGRQPPPRRKAPPESKPDATDVDLLLNHFRDQRTGLPAENDYTRFTYALEGWGRRPDGQRLRAHNHGHSWIGGIMNNTSTSPTDPMFWLHHAEVDRLWEIWRVSNPGPAPILDGSDRVMDPWAESYDDLLDVHALGYAYDVMSP